MTKEFRQTNRKEKLQEIKREKPDETKEVHIYRWEKGQYLHVHCKLCKHMRIMKQNNRSNMFQFHLFTDLILVYYGLHHLSPWNPDFGHFFLPLVSLNLASNTRSHQLLLWRLRGLVPAGGFGLCFCHHNWRAAAVERPTLGLCCNLKSLDSTAAGLFCLFCSLKKLYKMHIGLRLSEVRTSWNGIWWKSSSRCVWIFEGFRPFAKWHAVCFASVWIVAVPPNINLIVLPLAIMRNCYILKSISLYSRRSLFEVKIQSRISIMLSPFWKPCLLCAVARRWCNHI